MLSTEEISPKVVNLKTIGSDDGESTALREEKRQRDEDEEVP